MTNPLLHPATTLCSAGRSSCLAALLPSPILCCPGPALADMLSPDPLRPSVMNTIQALFQGLPLQWCHMAHIQMFNS